MAEVEICVGLKFGTDVSFSLPGEGGEFFTGGFLDLPLGEVGSLLRGGDIAEVVSDYEITTTPTGKTLQVNAQLGEMSFSINDDFRSLTDEFDRVWLSEERFEVVDPDAVDDKVGGDH